MVDIKLRPAAEVDIESAFAFYFERSPRSAVRLLLELDVALDRIGENPAQFPIIEEPVRRVLLHKFPYTIYYLVDGHTAIVLAVIHQRRHPDTWKRKGGT